MERIEETILAYRKRRARRLDERGAEERPDREDYGTKASGLSSGNYHQAYFH